MCETCLGYWGYAGVGHWQTTCPQTGLDPIGDGTDHSDAITVYRSPDLAITSCYQLSVRLIMSTAVCGLDPHHIIRQHAQGVDARGFALQKKKHRQHANAGGGRRPGEKSSSSIKHSSSVWPRYYQGRTCPAHLSIRPTPPVSVVHAFSALPQR